MFKDVHTPFCIDLSDELVARCDALASRLRLSPLGKQLHPTRELVIRLALLHGLDELEQLQPADAAATSTA